MTNVTITIKENSKFRITHLWNDYFAEGKNAFGRWVVIRSIQENEIETIWQQMEAKVNG